VSKNSVLKLLASDVDRFHATAQESSAKALVRRGLAEVREREGFRTWRITAKGLVVQKRLADSDKSRSFTD